MPRPSLTRRPGRAATGVVAVLPAAAGIARLVHSTGASPASSTDTDRADSMLAAAPRSSPQLPAHTSARSSSHPATPPVSPAPTSGKTRGSVTYYTVRDSFGGQPEFLFEIAQRFLGDSNRFRAIFDLNRTRPQPDGGHLTDPTVLNPGWLLILPDSAHGSGPITGQLAAPAPSGPSTQPTAPELHPAQAVIPRARVAAASEPISARSLAASVLTPRVAARPPRRSTGGDNR
jgi:hypothetical protein